MFIVQEKKSFKVFLDLGKKSLISFFCLCGGERLK